MNRIDALGLDGRLLPLPVTVAAQGSIKAMQRDLLPARRPRRGQGSGTAATPTIPCTPGCLRKNAVRPRC